MDLGNLAGQAQDALKNVGTEENTDAVLDKVADAAKSATGGRFDEQIDAARAAADEKLGQ
ncbi:MAG: antitoxin [Actinomycetaceae bacterium]|nr:antitoxin [Actinomycetaceae bacterium]